MLCPAIEAVLAASAGDLERADELSRSAGLTAASAGPYARGMAAWARAEVLLVMDQPSRSRLRRRPDSICATRRSPLTAVEVLAGWLRPRTRPAAADARTDASHSSPRTRSSSRTVVDERLPADGRSAAELESGDRPLGRRASASDALGAAAANRRSSTPLSPDVAGRLPHACRSTASLCWAGAAWSE